MSALSHRITKLLTELTLLGDGAAIDYSRDRISTGSGGIHAHRISNPTRDLAMAGHRPPVVVWTERIERVVAAGEAFLHDYRHGAPPRPQAGRSAAQARARLLQVMADYAGEDAVTVAFFERVSVETVRRVRREMGLDVSTGHPTERALTAPPADTLKSQEAH